MKDTHTLWVEKYRPTTLDTYIGNESLKEKVSFYLESGDLPHLLLYGKAGTGKTTLSKILVKNIECDYLYINASDENNVETVRTKIKNFASTIGFKDYKIITSKESQAIVFKSDILHKGVAPKNIPFRFCLNMVCKNND